MRRRVAVQRVAWTAVMTASPLAGLSDRELSVLALIAEGLSNQAAAQRLGISVKTVEAACRVIFQKLDLPDSADSNRRVRAAILYLTHAPPAADSCAVPKR